MRDPRGRTPLLKVATLGLFDVRPTHSLVRKLAAGGADINVQDESGWGCLHYYAHHVGKGKRVGRNRHALVAQELSDLLGAGASATLASQQSPTPLDVLLLHKRSGYIMRPRVAPTIILPFIQ